MIAKAAQGEPKVLEPNKCERWEWFSLNAFPQPLFLPLQNLLADNYKQKAITALINTHRSSQ
jgi:8-oxo-dGTP diphosphatase